MSDPSVWILIAIVLGLLAIATAVGQILKRQPETGLNPAAVAAFLDAQPR